MGDVFDTWLGSLPKERQFSPTELPQEAQGAFQKWMELSGRNMEPSYDYSGAFAAGVQPTQGHLPSFGRGGKLLKSPKHPTIWKTAFVELAHGLSGRWVDPDELKLDRESAGQYINKLYQDAATRR